MASTNTFETTVRRVLNKANPNEIADAFRKAKIGNMLSPVKVVAAGLTAAASFDITTAAFKALCTITGLELDSGENLPAALDIRSLRVVTGTATGQRAVSDSGATPSTSLATLSDDGKTITFEASVTAFTFLYMPRADTDLDTTFATQT